MKVNQEAFKYQIPLQTADGTIRIRRILPWEEKEQMAQDYAAAAIVFDEEGGIAYEGYNAELIRSFLILRYYTDIDLKESDTPQGRYEVYDAVASYELWPQIVEVVAEDLAQVDRIACRIVDAAKCSFERKHALEHQIGKLLKGLLGTESLTETISKAEGLNSKLIEMLGILHRSPALYTGVPLARKAYPESNAEN